jgi:hypothetical protein
MMPRKRGRCWGHAVQRYVAEHLLLTSVAFVPFVQAARTYVKGYEPLYRNKLRLSALTRCVCGRNLFLRRQLALEHTLIGGITG